MYLAHKSGSTIKNYGDSTTISVQLRNNSSYQVVFYVTSKVKKTLSFKKNETEAHRVAKSIAYDLDSGNLTLDDLVTLTGKEIIALYQQSKDTRKLILIESIKSENDNVDNRNLREIWEQYKLIAISHSAKSTQNKLWKTIDNFLEKLTDNELNLANINKLATYSLKYYSVGSLRTMFRLLQAALNVVINGKPIGSKKAYSNDFKLVDQLPKQQKSKIEFYSQDEVKIILDAFETQYYYPFTLFCALTGCRPSEGIALTVNDVKISGNKVQVLINKAFSQGVFNHHTKNYKIRLIPLIPSLAKFMIDYCKGKDKNDLLFPSVNGGYINQENYTRRHYKPIVESLVKQGLVRQYLSPYSLRHSFVTNMIQNSVDISTIAGLIGDNVKTVIDFYLGSTHENADLPDIY